MKWEKVENDRGLQGTFRDILLVHRKKTVNSLFTDKETGRKKEEKVLSRKGQG